MKKLKSGYWHNQFCLSKCKYQVVFCTQRNRHFINSDIKKRLYQMIHEKQYYWEYEVLELEIKSNYVRMIVQCDPNLGINDVIAKIRRYTAGNIKREFFPNAIQINMWTRSRFIETIGEPSVGKVELYLKSQKRQK